MRQPYDRGQMVHWLRDLLCGVLIGVGAILPGVSGGVLAVVFDIYRPFMELLTSPGTALPKYWMWFPPIVLGWCIGFLGLAQGLSAAFDRSAAVTVWLFIGLIAGTLPSLFREAGREGRNAASGCSFLLCGMVFFAVLFYVSRVLRLEAEPNFFWYNVCGVLWGIGIVVPGFTSSAVMMALGLYEPMLEGLARLDLPVLSACIPGLLVTILLLSRIVSWIFRRFYAVAFHGILGIVAASTAAIIPTAYTDWKEITCSALCCAGGFLLALFLQRLDRRAEG